MLARVLWTVGVWVLCGVGCLGVIAGSSTGPILFSVDHAHGVHLGDVLSVVGFPAFAWWVSRAFWLPERERSRAER